MRLRKLTMLLVLSAFLPAAGCADTSLLQPESAVDVSEHADQRYDINGLKQQISEGKDFFLAADIL